MLTPRNQPRVRKKRSRESFFLSATGEDVEVAAILVKGDADGGRDGGGDVVAEPVVADPLVAPRRRQHVDGDGGVGHRARPERPAVKRAHQREKKQSARQQVEPVKQETQQHEEHQHLLAVERIDDVAAERTEQQRRHGIARQHHPDDILRGTEMLAQIDRKQGRKNIKGEE